LNCEESEVEMEVVGTRFEAYDLNHRLIEAVNPPFRKAL
jgi:hypothetical protein